LIVAIVIWFSDRWKGFSVSSRCFFAQSLEDFNLLLDVVSQAVSVLHSKLLDVGKIEADIVICCTLLVLRGLLWSQTIQGWLAAPTL
jgi:hypothetical protein